MNELRMYINGEWVESESGEYFDAYNPATLEVIARTIGVPLKALLTFPKR